MKRSFSFSLLAAFAAAGFAAAEPVYTTPVGYVTQEIKASSFNLLGVPIHNPVLLTGQLTSIPNATSVRDSAANFSGLDSGTYILEITGVVAYAGTIQDFNSVTTTDIIDLPEDFVSLLSGNESYRIRKAATLGSVFGETNQAGLLAGTTNTADLVLVPNGAGGFDTFYYSSGGFAGIGWRKVGSGSTNFVNQPLIYTDAVFLRRRGTTDISFVISGEVKMDKTVIGVFDQYSYIGNPYAAGVTLGNSGLQNSVLAGTTNSADLILIPNPDGGFLSYYYSSGGFAGIGWRLVGGGSTDRANVALTPGMIINRRQAPFNISLEPSF